MMDEKRKGSSLTTVEAVCHWSWEDIWCCYVSVSRQNAMATTM